MAGATLARGATMGLGGEGILGVATAVGASVSVSKSPVLALKLAKQYYWSVGIGGFAAKAAYEHGGGHVKRKVVMRGRHATTGTGAQGAMGTGRGADDVARGLGTSAVANAGSSFWSHVRRRTEACGRDAAHAVSQGSRACVAALRRAIAGAGGDAGPTTTPNRTTDRVSFRDHTFAPMTEANEVVRAVLILAVARFCRFFAENATRSFEVVGAEVMHDAVMAREPGQALITVSNHTAAIDDPFVISNLVPEAALRWPRADLLPATAPSDASETAAAAETPKHVLDPAKVRWTMCATDRCFGSDLASAFFRSVQVLPIDRGAGLHQPGMRAASELLRSGAWVHIFPEGTRSVDGKLKRVRSGVGQLVVNCAKERARGVRGAHGAHGAHAKAPLVVPFVHIGMDTILPKGSKFPAVGGDLAIRVGEPIPVDDIVTKVRRGTMSDAQARREVVARVESALSELHRQCTAQAQAQRGGDGGSVPTMAT